jgi:predicted 3-demethylubiquinone-9 3-methyltransferase (glyoxalase superfamily)
MQKITPFLWFNDQAEEAAHFYVSLFKNSGIGSIARYGEGGAEVSGKAQGSVMTVAFQLEGQDFMALNGGPLYTFSPAISFMVGCETQQEIDRLWEKLTEGAESVQCGWVKDKYGVTWQIVPAVLEQLLQGQDSVRTERVMKALLQMEKIDIAGLERAYRGR